MATDLGSRPLVFDPTSANPGSGDEVNIGLITFSRDGSNVVVNYQIDPSFQTQYDLKSVHTRLNGGIDGDVETPNLPANTESFQHVISLPPEAYLEKIEACAGTDKRDIEKVEDLFPTYGSVTASANGLITIPGYFDTVFQPGRVVLSTDVGANTVTFSATESVWDTGQAIRVIVGFGEGLTPSATNTTAGIETITFAIPHGLSTGNPVRVATTGGGLLSNVTYYARVTNVNTISLYSSASSAAVGGATGRMDLTAPITSLIYGTSTTGLVRTPVSSSATSSQSFFVRHLGGNQYLLYDTYANAMAGGATGVRDVTATVPTDGSLVFVGENESLFYLGQAPIANSQSPSSTDTVGDTISFSTDPLWANGTAIRLDRAAGGLAANTTYFVNKTAAATYRLYDTAANAIAGTLTGRRNITASVTAVVFDQVNSLTFPNPHQWSTGTIVRPSVSVGGLQTTSNYYVRVIDQVTVSLHTSLAAAQGNLNPVNFTAPVTATISPMFAGWCLDVDRAFPIGSELMVKAYSSYDLDSLRDTSRDPKNLYPNENGLVTQNMGAVPLSTDVTNDTVTFTAAHNLTTGEEIRVTSDSNVLLSTTSYFARVINTTTIAFYDTAAHASAGGVTGRSNLTGSIASSSVVYRVKQIDFSVNLGWTTGTKVRVDTAGGGLITGADYFLRVVDPNSITLHPTLASALGNSSLVPLTGPLSATTKIYIQETIVEKPENLDVMNWVFNQNYQNRLAAGQTISATTLANGNVLPSSTNYVNTGTAPISTNVAAGVETVQFAAAHAFVTGDPIRVTSTVGGLTKGVTYYARAVSATTLQFYDTASNAMAGTTVGLKNLTAPITAGVYSAALTSLQDSVTFPAGHGFQTGDEVTVTATGGGLTAGTSYFLYQIAGDSFSLHSATPNANNKVDLTAAISARFTGDAVSVPVAAWTTKMRVQVSASGGGLNAGQDYFIRALTPTLIAFYATDSDAGANINRINLTSPLSGEVIPYYSMNDIQRTVWELVENNPGTFGNASPQRVAVIMSEAEAAVGIGRTTVDYLPECEGVVGLLLQQYRIDQATGASIAETQVALAVVPTARIPGYCVDGYNCQTLELEVPRATLGDFVWRDINNNGEQDVDEPGMADVTVELFTSASVPVGAPFITGSDGKFSFTNLAAGSYYLKFTPPTGQVFTVFQAVGVTADRDSDVDANGITPPFTLAAGEINDSVDAGIRPIDLSLTKTVSDPFPPVDAIVTFDTVVTNALDFSLATGVIVIDNFPIGQLQFLTSSVTQGIFDPISNLWTIGEIAPGASVTLTMTAKVLVGGLIVNDAEVYDADQPDLDSSPNNNPGVHEDDDDAVSLLPTGTIGDFVWRDLDINGIQNVGEPGIAGFTVDLMDEPSAVVLASTTTNASGYYQFTDVNPGTYTLRFTPPTSMPGQVFTTKGAIGSTAENDSNVNASGITDSFTLGSGVNEWSLDAGVKPVDLELTKTVDDLSPQLNQTVTYTLTLTNNEGMSDAYDVTVNDLLPDGVTFQSATASQGSYSNSTKLWSVGTLPAGSTVTLSLVVEVTGGGTVVNYAEVQSASPEDTDSKPGNDSTTEDDDATATFTVSSTIGDFVWRDLDINGIQNVGEPGIAGFIVDLMDEPSLVVLASTTTNASGYYLFTDVNPGTYTLRFTPPTSMPGQVFTTKGAIGSTAENDSNVNASGITDSFTLGSGVNEWSLDAGVKPVDLELTKTVDDLSPQLNQTVTYTLTLTNKEGMSDAYDVTVSDLLPDGVTFQSATASQGSYSNSTELWSVGTLPTGSTVTLSLVVEVTGGGTVVNYAEVYSANPEDTDSKPGNDSTTEDDDATATFTVSSTIGDFVWRDLDLNGIQNVGEPGIAGFIVDLMDEPSLVVLASTTTNASGYYLFTDVNPGTYTLRFTPPTSMPGQVFTTKGAIGSTAENDSNVNASGITDSFTLGSGVNEWSLDAGVKPVDLELTKTVDDLSPQLNQTVTYTLTLTNKEGMSDAYDVTVSDLLPDGVTFQSATASQGSYSNSTELWSVGTLPAGSTVTLSLVVEVTGGGTVVNYAEVYSASPEDTDSKPGNDSTTEDDDATATFTVSSTIGDFVWRDLDLNGIQNVGEPGIAGFIVDLMDEPSLVVLASTTTNASGYYLFTDVNPGTYTLRFTPPTSMPGQVFTTKGAIGSTAENDSNVNASGITDSFTLGAGASNLTIDAGVKPIDLELQKFVDWKIANDREDPGEEMYAIGNQRSFVFTIRVANAAGMSTATDVVVKDVIPPGMIYVDSPANYVASQGTFTGGLWTVGTLAGGAAATLKVTVTADSSSATPPPLGGTPNSIGSLFEGGDGNLIVAPGNENLYYDWANKAPNLVTQIDQPDDVDDIFKTGSKEDDPVPVVDFDQSAPNKDNLLRFYTAHDQLGSNAFLYLAWVRSNTTGDANIDFELNQSRTISGNTVTPIRTVGDLLLSYEFSQGGDQPNIYARLWQAASGSQPEQWSARTALDSSIALAAVNTTSVLDLDGTTTLTAGQFGEAAINLTKAFQSINPNQCQNFSSAFVKTRASTSFQAELKDFIAPIEVQVTNCVTVRNVAEVTRPLVSDYDSTPDNGAQPIPEDDWDSLLLEIYPLGAIVGGQSGGDGAGGAALSSFLGGSGSAPVSLMFIDPTATGSVSFIDGGTKLGGDGLSSSDTKAVDEAVWCVIESEESSEVWTALSSNVESNSDQSSRDSADTLFDRLDREDLVDWLS
jgi:uncharacterized repeat protein (TIGR01451 family)